MKFVFLLLVALMISGLCGATEIVPDYTALTLTGKVSLESAYGPPGFGENPATDRKEAYFALTLDRSIQMKNADGALIDVVKIQLIDNSKRGQNIALLVGKKAKADGEIWTASTGHHHEKAVLMLTSIAGSSK